MLASQVGQPQSVGTRAHSVPVRESESATANLEDLIQDDDFGINDGNHGTRASTSVSSSHDDVLDDLLRAAGRDDALASTSHTPTSGIGAMNASYAESDDFGEAASAGDGNHSDSFSLDASLGFTSGTEEDSMLGVSPAEAVCEPDPRVEMLERAIENEKVSTLCKPSILRDPHPPTVPL